MSMFEFIKVPRLLLSMLAIYPKTESSLFYRFRAFISMGSIVAFGSCLSYYAALQVGDVVKLSESLYMTITILNSGVKAGVLIYKKNNFFKCIAMLEAPSFITYNEKYDSVLKQLTKICVGTQIIHGFFCNVSVLTYALIPVWGSKPLPFEFTHFNSGPFHYPFYVFQVISLYIVAHANICLDFLSVGFIMISATQLRKLNRKLVDMEENVRNVPNYTKDNVEMLTLEYLKECCIHYGDIEEFSKCLQDCFSLISFIQLVTGCVSICNALMLMQTVSLISGEALALMVYILCMLCEVGLYCWFGNFVYNESLEIGTSCYFSSWYECTPRIRRTLFILMERTKRPIEVKALSLITLNLQTYISILKWTYSYFTLLENLTD